MAELDFDPFFDQLKVRSVSKNDSWILGNDHKALGELLASVDSLDEIEEQIEFTSGWRDTQHGNTVEFRPDYRYRRKQKRLAAPWLEIRPGESLLNCLVFDGDTHAQAFEYCDADDVKWLLEDGCRYWMPLSALPPVFEGE